MANTRVKIKRETLIKKLEEAREARMKQYEQEKEEYDKKNNKLLKGLIAGAKEWLDLAESDSEKALKKVHYGYGGSRGTDKPYYYATIHIHSVEYPKEKPRPHVGNIDSMLRVLKASEDETISVSTEDDYAKYL